jgi:threonylcarbamoyladenosine tRNA methylthiotransferase MtaB
MRVYLRSLGCKLNQSEIESMARRFVAFGYHLAMEPEEADIFVVNTCTVTHAADRKSRQLIRRLRRANPSAFVVATGCYAEISPTEIEADLIVGNEEKEKLVEIVEGAWMKSKFTEGSSAVRFPYSHTRAFVKIQDGCDNACTYCIVRIARGRQRSRPSGEILEEIRRRLEEGYKEVVLTGVNIGAYRSEENFGLWSLIEMILTKTEVPRLRLSSIEPWDFSLSSLDLWSDSRLCCHLHLPLQSGCDETLRRMGRRYTSEEFSRLVNEARSRIPDLAVTTDIIVGFPGETEAEFDESYRFVEGMGFARSHIFKYSARPGTQAAKMPNQVPYSEKKRRSEAMIALARRSSKAFRRRFIGRNLEVLWEGRVRVGRKERRSWFGLTDNYIRVVTESEKDLTNTITPTQLVALTEDGVRGEVIRDKIC